jgi:hypothetical protein
MFLSATTGKVLRTSSTAMIVGRFVPIQYNGMDTENQVATRGWPRAAARQISFHPGNGAGQWSAWPARRRKPGSPENLDPRTAARIHAWPGGKVFIRLNCFFPRPLRG